MAAEEGYTVTFIFTGVEGEDIPENATRFIAHESATVIPELLFYQHPNIVELICHAGVIRIEEWAFYNCRRLRRVVIPGVKIVEADAFHGCEAVTYVKCPKLERIGDFAFEDCKSLSNIDLPSAKIVEGYAFHSCSALTDVKFGKNLESIGRGAFTECPSLKQVIIPLKNGLFAAENIFQACVNLKSVDLVEETVLRETIAALLLEEWRDDTNEEIDSINQILPHASAGDQQNEGGKAIAIRSWISRVLRTIIHYKAEHRRLSNEASTLLTHTLPNDIVMNHVLPFLKSPLHTFEGEDHEEGEEGSINNDETDESRESYDTSEGGDDDEDKLLNNGSLGGGHHEEDGDDDDEGRKRRKTSNDTESRGEND